MTRLDFFKVIAAAIAGAGQLDARQPAVVQGGPVNAVTPQREDHAAPSLPGFYVEGVHVGWLRHIEILMSQDPIYDEGFDGCSRYRPGLRDASARVELLVADVDGFIGAIYPGLGSRDIVRCAAITDGKEYTFRAVLFGVNLQLGQRAAEMELRDVRDIVISESART